MVGIPVAIFYILYYFIGDAHEQNKIIIMTINIHIDVRQLYKQIVINQCLIYYYTACIKLKETDILK